MNQALENEPNKPAASQEEIDVGFQGPAPYITKTLLTLSPVTARLIFLEISPNGRPEFRAAVTMGINELVSLRALIDRMLEGK